jgi:UDP-N-acetyl-D-mannosaminuronic acid dehydrogenase
VLEDLMLRATASVCVIGLGTTGLPLAALWARRGFRVIGVDKALGPGDPPDDWCPCRFTEAGLGELYRSQIRSGRLQLQNTVPSGADAYVVCVPTPLDVRTRRADLRLLHVAVEQLAEALSATAAEGERERLVVLESTVPPGTTARIADRLRGACPALTLRVAYCAERSFPGRLLHEMVHNTRVIGALDPPSAAAARALYAAIAEGELQLTDPQTAEFVKLTENAYRDVNLAFANEIARLAEQHGVDPSEAIALANHHPRVHILRPGCGVGGECIPVDPWFLLPPGGADATLIPAARALNDRVPHRLAGELLRRLAEGNGRLRGLPVAALGVTYRPEIPDTRNSPALTIIRRLRAEGVALRVADPVLGALSPGEGVRLEPLDSALDAVDAVILLVDHRCFDRIPGTRLGSRPRRKRLLDASFSPDLHAWEASGFEVVRIGAPSCRRADHGDRVTPAALSAG